MFFLKFYLKCNTSYFIIFECKQNILNLNIDKMTLTTRQWPTLSLSLINELNIYVLTEEFTLSIGLTPYQ